jgi:diguanylate cyclase (GGDEF)-like protein/PAS domain S-box-containing protein
MSKANATRTTQDRYADVFMGFVFIATFLAITGWVVNKPVLAAISTTFIPMAPGTALIFLGMWITWFIRRILTTRGGIRIIIPIIQIGMMIIVVLLAFRALTGLGPDLEKLIYHNPPLLGQVSTARMSPLSALGFLLSIPALILITRREPGKQARSATAGLALVLFALSSLIILGYLYGAPLFYGGTTIPVALTSALSFWFLSLGLLEMAGPSTWPVSAYMGHSLRARLLRAFVPALVIIVLIQGLLSTAGDPWITNPALKVAIAAVAASVIVIIIVSLLVRNLSADFERGKQAETALEKSEAELRALFASMKDVVIVFDVDGRYIEIAPTDPSNLYRPPAEMLGKALHDILPKEQADINLAMIRESIQTGTVVNGEYALQVRGKETWFAASASRLSENTAILVAHDITKRKHFELVQNAIFRITQASITGEGIDELYHSIHSILGELIPAENFYIASYDPVKELVSFPYYIDQFDEAPPTPTPVQGLTGYVLRTGHPLLAPPEVFDRLVQQREVEIVGTPGEDWMGAPLTVEGRIIGVMAVQSYSKEIHFNQEDLNLLEFVSSQAAQVIERKRMEQEIVNLSFTDELTGLYNRRGFSLLAEQEMKLAYRFKRSVSLFFCDIDDLKTINDSFGHAQGDAALKEVSAILKETFREADIPARIGGDEFVVLAPDTSVDSADSLPNRLQTTLEKYNQKGERPYHLSLSVGISRFNPDTPHTVNELISQADELMYLQKKEKKGKSTTGRI